MPGGTTELLKCPTLCKGLTNKTVAQKMPKTPPLRNSGTFHSADEEMKGRFAWDRDRSMARPTQRQSEG